MDDLEAIGRAWERGWNALQGVELGYLLEPRYLVLAGIVVVLFLLLLYLRTRPPKKIRAFRGDTGPVEVSRHALLELVHATCAELPEIRKPSVRVRDRGGLRLTVRIQVNGSAHLRDTASQLQALLKESLESNLGVERLRAIEVLVTGIRKRGRTSADRNPPPPAEAVALGSGAGSPAPAPMPAGTEEPPGEAAAPAREHSRPGEPAPTEAEALPPEEEAGETHREEAGEAEEPGNEKTEEEEEGSAGESVYPSPAAESPPRRRRFWKKT